VKTALPLYYHPTAVCFVDDNYSFSQSLALTIPEDMHLTTFLSPDEALDIVNIPHPRPPLADLCFSQEGNLIRLDLNVLEQEIKHIDRFERISVMLVDYAMPTMNGLEFCAQLTDRDVRRVLLTGVADEKTAVQAFNAGLIDHYLPKAKLSSPGGVVPYILDQQQRYFQSYQSRLTKALGIATPDFTQDPAFCEYFYQLIDDNAIAEYYMVTHPAGYLCLTNQGKSKQLVVQDSNTKAHNLRLMEEFSAPAKLIEKVRGDAALVCFFEHPADYSGDEQFPWDEATFPVSVVNGRDRYLCCLVEEPPADIDFDPTESSYQKHLQQTLFN
jgi:CheY-like chemotaxis protein